MLRGETDRGGLTRCIGPSAKDLRLGSADNSVDRAAHAAVRPDERDRVGGQPRSAARRPSGMAHHERTAEHRLRVADPRDGVPVPEAIQLSWNRRRSCAPDRVMP